jgi:transcriptional regulator with XRE-family HTH domain
MHQTNLVGLKFGKSYNMVNSYVQNRQQPPLEVLHKIAHILDVDITILLVKTKEDTNE